MVAHPRGSWARLRPCESHAILEEGRGLRPSQASSCEVLRARGEARLERRQRLARGSQTRRLRGRGVARPEVGSTDRASVFVRCIFFGTVTRHDCVVTLFLGQQGIVGLKPDEAIELPPQISAIIRSQRTAQHLAVLGDSDGADRAGVIWRACGTRHKTSTYRAHTRACGRGRVWTWGACTQGKGSQHHGRKARVSPVPRSKTLR